MGFDVAVTGVPDRFQNDLRHSDVRDAVHSDFRFAPGQLLFANGPATRPTRFSRLLAWGPGRKPASSAIGLDADMAARSVWQNEFADLLRSRAISHIHVNHCFNMDLAARISAFSRRRHGAAPFTILETHDVQVERYVNAEIVNPLTGMLDKTEELARDELELSRKAHALVHLTNADCRHFNQLLPDKPHFVVRPTLRHEPPPSGHAFRKPPIDFMFVGDGHCANRRGVEWFLNSVMPLLPSSAVRIRFAGRIARAIRTEQPALHAAHPDLWLDELPSVSALYAAARYVIAPAVAASGVSIKVIEALAMGKFAVASPAAMSGFDGIGGIDQAVHTAPSAVDFAQAMIRLAEGPTSFNAAGREIYDEYFSEGAYGRALARVMNDLGLAPG
jgi:glycosyltransferase involved in cell wall biosynthesis